MKAMIVYASWFGHNRAIAKALARELTERHVTVVCAPASRIAAQEVVGVDLLVLGTYTHAGRANRRLRNLCDTIPRRRLDRIAVAIFGTQIAEVMRDGEPGGVDELVGHLQSRGYDLALPPLRLGLRGAATFLPWLGIGDEERRQLKAFAEELLEVCVPAPFI